jgi:DNA mismatch repair ATPase MutS
VDAVGSAVSKLDRELRLLAEVLQVLETERFEAPWLTGLQDRLGSTTARPSTEIDRLRRLSEHLDSRHNLLFAPFAWLLSWGVQVASAIEDWRRETGSRLPDWFAAVGSAEAALALASYAWERPDDSFPELVAGEPRIEADGLVHPLLPDASAVRNDVVLGGDQRLLIVSGSNMSGKSTLLRSVGTNVVLALAGAPVRAHRMRLTPVAIGASIGIGDSLLGGRSRFFAEITRLKRIVDACDGELPVLFLLDELFGGTNSHDRRIGAELLLAALLERDAIGLVTTHDLALAPMAESLGPAANVHFSDQLEAGELAFDYRLRPGTVTRSNALALMRAVGLPVPEAAVE